MVGPGAPEVATGLNNLASLYKDQGRYADAEPLNMRALAIYKKALGPDHPKFATALNNLASLDEVEVVMPTPSCSTSGLKRSGRRHSVLIIRTLQRR